MDVDFRTEKEKLRDAEHERIASRYIEYRQNYPSDVVSDNKIFAKISSECGRTLTNVRTICMKAGVTAPCKSVGL